MTAASIKRELPIAPRIPDQHQFSPVGEPHRMMGLKEIYELLRRRLGLMTFVIVLGTALSAVVAYYAPKTYRASSMVVLERTDTRPFAPDADLKSLERDRSAADTELDVLTSRIFLGRVVDRLNLVNHPDFNTYLRDAAKPNSNETNAFSDVFSTLVAKVKSPFPSEPAAKPSVSKQRDRAITKVLSRLAVARRGESLAVTVTVSHGDAELAAAIANAVASLYVEATLEFKRDDRVADSARAVAADGAVALLRERVTQPLLTTLRSEEARLLRERAELASTFGKNHPKILNTDAELVSVQRMIAEEIQRILLGLENEAAKPSARVVSLAEVPTSPYFPVPSLVIAGGFVGSSVLAALLVILLEAADTRIRGGEQTRSILRIPNLASVPRIRAKDVKVHGHNIAEYLIRRPQSAYAEAMRSLYVACRIPSTDRLHKVIAFTSCLPREGTTTSALGLALTAVADGQRTLLLDLDLHHCEVVKTLNLQLDGLSLDRYLQGEYSVSELLQKVPNWKGLDVIGSHWPKASGNLLNSNRFRELFQAVRPHYDVIVVDTPPILSVDDANWVSPLVDAMILVVSWGNTKEEVLAEGAARLRMTQAPLLGTIINKVMTGQKRRNGKSVGVA